VAAGWRRGRLGGAGRARGAGRRGGAGGAAAQGAPAERECDERQRGGERERSRRRRRSPWTAAAAALCEDGGSKLGQPAGVVSLRAQKSLAVFGRFGGKWGRKKGQLYLEGSLVPVRGVSRDQCVISPGSWRQPGPMSQRSRLMPQTGTKDLGEGRC
jgi:hypothetical protein